MIISDDLKYYLAERRRILRSEVAQIERMLDRPARRQPRHDDDSSSVCIVGIDEPVEANGYRRG